MAPNQWHSTDEELFHDCVECDAGKQVFRSGNVEWGTGSKRHCEECQQLMKDGQCTSLSKVVDDAFGSPFQV